jgi:hypothetical protein
VEEEDLFFGCVIVEPGLIADEIFQRRRYSIFRIRFQSEVLTRYGLPPDVNNFLLSPIPLRPDLQTNDLEILILKVALERVICVKYLTHSTISSCSHSIYLSLAA